jgi:hypothetical protein
MTIVASLFTSSVDLGRFRGSAMAFDERQQPRVHLGQVAFGCLVGPMGQVGELGCDHGPLPVTQVTAVQVHAHHETPRITVVGFPPWLYASGFACGQPVTAVE